ncbi:hypothetical protein EV363DRAFT_1297559 [Boletus edulis]|nr:hypothetical protein EV363DRAFT_1297559 [Boletus edulis]
MGVHVRWMAWTERRSDPTRRGSHLLVGKQGGGEDVVRDKTKTTCRVINLGSVFSIGVATDDEANRWPILERNRLQMTDDLIVAFWRCCLEEKGVGECTYRKLGTYEDRRVIRLQKIPDEVLDDQMPHTLSLSAHDELTDLTKPGSRLTGIFGSLSVEDAIGGTPTELEAKLIELTKCESAEQKRLVNKMLARWEAVPKAVTWLYSEVTFRTPDVFPVAFDDRLANNVGYLDAALRLRRQIAEILQYDLLADYITEVKMVKAYYDHLYVERNLDLDDSLVKEYFPVSVVVPAIPEPTWGQIRRDHRRCTGCMAPWSVFSNAPKLLEWMTHGRSEAQQFAVSEKDVKDESGFVGYCYLDPSLAVWGRDTLGFVKPHSPMVANLAKPTPERPALMRHDDVTTFFHEMGHVFHGLLSRTKYSRFHGTAVARDFVEAPSQMLENWCWEAEVLKRMSSHYKTQEPLSDDLIAKIIKSRYVNVGLFYLRQLFFANFDFAVHNNSLDVNMDYTKLWNELREKISLVQGSEDKPGQGTFGHIVVGYDVGYYGYTYSLVFAADMYARMVFKKASLDPALGRLYRDKILFVGGSRDDMGVPVGVPSLIMDFLGREPDPKAFINEIEQDGNGDAARASNL